MLSHASLNGSGSLREDQDFAYIYGITRLILQNYGNKRLRDVCLVDLSIFQQWLTADHDPHFLNGFPHTLTSPQWHLTMLPFFQLVHCVCFLSSVTLCSMLLCRHIPFMFAFKHAHVCTYLCTVCVCASPGSVPGMRPAEAGEFTRRAFQAGKMGLTEVGQAEQRGVNSDGWKRIGVSFLGGTLQDKIKGEQRHSNSGNRNCIYFPVWRFCIASLFSSPTSTKSTWEFTMSQSKPFQIVKGGGAWRSDPCRDRGPEEAGTQADVGRTRTPLSGLEPEVKAGKFTSKMFAARWSREHCGYESCFGFIKTVVELLYVCAVGLKERPLNSVWWQSWRAGSEVV